MLRVTHEKRSSGTKINLEGTAGADGIERGKERHSSGTSTRSAGRERKKHKLGLIKEEDTDSESTQNQKEWSEDEFLLSYNDALEWGKGLISLMKSSIKSIKISTRSVSKELKRLKIAKNANEKRMDDLENAMQNVSDNVEKWVKEEAVLLAQMNDLRERHD